MATVYRGEHVSGIGMVAAVKKLHPHLAIDEELRARLKVEAQALARLKHKNIVQIFDYVDVDGSCALVTELVEGRTLRAVMAEFSDWPMPLSMALRLFRQILDGVGHAHRHSCLHRDLKPGNIMVTSENEVKILDFGIANLIDTEAITRTGVSMGTPVYMAPEQLEGRRDLDQRTDLYSLGMTLWEMLAGHGARPIGERGWRLGDDHIEGLLDRGVPASLIQVVHRLVQVDRDERYTSCEEVLEALSDILEEGVLDEESCLALAGVAPMTTSSEAPTFEFEATQQSQRSTPITQTVLQGSTSMSGCLSKGMPVFGLLMAVGLSIGVYQGLLGGDKDGATPAQVETSQGHDSVGALENSVGDAEELVSSETEGEVVQAQLSLLLLSDPPGAKLRLDGEELGDVALIKKVPAEEKDYLLTGEMDGYHKGSLLCRVDKDVIAEGTLRCAVSLVRIPSARSTPRPSSRPPDREQSSSVDEEQGLPAGTTDDKPTIHKID